MSIEINNHNIGNYQIKPKIDRFSILKNPDRVSSFIGIMSFCSLFIAVTYNYSYFYIVGLEFFSLLSPIDYIKSAIKVAPIIFSVLAGAMIAKIVNKSIDDEDEEAYIKTHLLVRNIIKYLLIFLNLIALIALFSVDYLADNAIISYLAFFIVQIICFFVLISRKFELWSDFSTSTRNFFFSMIVLLSGSIAFGLDHGWSDINDIEPSIKIYNSSSGSSLSKLDNNPFSARVLRMIEKGILFKDTDNKLTSFIPWDDVKIIQKNKDKTSTSYIINTFRNGINSLKEVFENVKNNTIQLKHGNKEKSQSN